MVKSHEQANQLHDKTSIWETIISDSSTDTLTKGILHSVLYVAHELENERAVILPDVSKIFLTQYLVNEHTTLESSEGTVNFSSKWLIRQLAAHLYPHIASKCVHKNFGTLHWGNKMKRLFNYIQRVGSVTGVKF